MDNTMEKQVIEVLAKIRPYIQRDGGDLEYVKTEEDGTVYVRVLGACVGCGAIDTTYKLGVEALLIEEVPGVKEVIVME